MMLFSLAFACQCGPSQLLRLPYLIHYSAQDKNTLRTCFSDRLNIYLFCSIFFGYQFHLKMLWFNLLFKYLYARVDSAIMFLSQLMRELHYLWNLCLQRLLIVLRSDSNKCNIFIFLILATHFVPLFSSEPIKTFRLALLHLLTDINSILILEQ